MIFDDHRDSYLHYIQDANYINSKILDDHRI